MVFILVHFFLQEKKRIKGDNAGNLHIAVLHRYETNIHFHVVLQTVFKTGMIKYKIISTSFFSRTLTYCIEILNLITLNVSLAITYFKMKKRVVLSLEEDNFLRFIQLKIRRYEQFYQCLESMTSVLKIGKGRA